VFIPPPTADRWQRFHAGLRQEVTVERDGWGRHRTFAPHRRGPRGSPSQYGAGSPLADGSSSAVPRARQNLRNPEPEPSRSIRVFVLRLRTLPTSADATLPIPSRDKVLESLPSGVNQFIASTRKIAPCEFSLLRYEPAPWQPSDTWPFLHTCTERDDNRGTRTKSRHSKESAGADRAKDLYPRSREDTRRRRPQSNRDGSQRSAPT